MSSPRSFCRSVLLYYIFLAVVLLLAIKGLSSLHNDYGTRIDLGSSLHIALHKSETPQSGQSHGLWSPSSTTVIRPGDVPALAHEETFQEPEPEPEPYEPGGVVGSSRDIREDRFYRGGLLTLEQTSHSVNTSAIYDPYPEYNSNEWRKSWLGKWQACEGPRGVDLDRTDSRDMMSVYPGIQKDFPRPKLGAFDSLGLDGQVCADRKARLGIYGHGEDSVAKSINWTEVNWGQLQTKCYSRNSGRYQSGPPGQNAKQSVLPLPGQLSKKRQSYQKSTNSSSPQYQARTAVVLRAWHSMEWTPNLVQYVRSVIQELSLHSGGEYEVYILVHVKDDDISIYTGDDTVARLKTFIPPEFHDMIVFFNEETLRGWYPDVPEHEVKWQNYQAIQIFAQAYQFDHYWQLEVDARFTGHTYHFLDRAADFSKQQPRKYLWERNSYFYSRDAHGPWNEFMQMVDKSMVQKESVWGPVFKEDVTPVGPQPPVVNPDEDDYKWGVGEEADFITFLPIFDPAETEWVDTETVWGLSPDIPRRVAVVAMARLSKTLLDTMHDAQVEKGWGLSSEMTASTFALWHGLKAVHVPHPIYVDGHWTSKELARILNTGPPERIAGIPDSVWNSNNAVDHIFYRFSFLYCTQTAEDLYRRWMGYKINPDEPTDGLPHQDAQGRNWYENGDLREDLYGRLCYPAMFLHTVKNPEPVKATDSGHMAVPVDAPM